MGQWVGALGWSKVAKISKTFIVMSPPETPTKNEKRFFRCQLEDLPNPERVWTAL